MAEQNYGNHRRFVPLFHFVLASLIVAGLIGSLVNLYRSLGAERLYNESLLVLVFLCLAVLFYYAREFALRVQDRAIRAEESLRHYILTGQRLDPRLTVRQIVGLRFAGDAEFADLARRAAEEGLSRDTIKRAIGSWRADHDRA